MQLRQVQRVGSFVEGAASGSRRICVLILGRRVPRPAGKPWCERYELSVRSGGRRTQQKLQRFARAFSSSPVRPAVPIRCELARPTPGLLLSCQKRALCATQLQQVEERRECCPTWRVPARSCEKTARIPRERAVSRPGPSPHRAAVASRHFLRVCKTTRPHVTRRSTEETPLGLLLTRVSARGPPRWGAPARARGAPAAPASTTPSSSVVEAVRPVPAPEPRPPPPAGTDLSPPPRPFYGL